MTAKSLLSVSVTLIPSKENVTNDGFIDGSKVHCSTLQNSASIETMQNFFRFAPSITEFEEEADAEEEEEDIFIF